MSLRGRLLALLVGLSAAGLLVVGAVSFAALRSYLNDRVEKQALTALPEVLRELSEFGPGPGFGPGGRPPDEARVPGGTYGALLEDGRVVKDVTIGDFRGRSEEPDLPGDLPLSESRDDLRFTDVDDFRVIATPLPNGQTLVAAIPLAEVQDTLGQLVRIELIVAAGVLLALALAAFWLVRLGLSPLERMGRTAGAIAAGDYSRRVEPATERTEVGRLGLALNAMLGQIERAFAERTASEERLRRFLSDASHELRTPLASIRGYAELHRMGALVSRGDREGAMTRIEAEAKRMGVLVEDLLTLARLDEERELLREDVDLGELAREATDAARAAAPDRSIELTAAAGVVVEGDAGRLRQVIDNLVRNALTHTPAGTSVELRVARTDRTAELEVRDHGPGLPPGDPASLFERFWRSEGGRERGKAGAGLGLAIVAGIVDAHAGTVTASDAPGGGARFSVSLPLA